MFISVIYRSLQIILASYVISDFEVIVNRNCVYVGCPTSEFRQINRDSRCSILSTVDVHKTQSLVSYRKSLLREDISIAKCSALYAATQQSAISYYYYVWLHMTRCK